jgi:hypothetical protein
MQFRREICAWLQTSNPVVFHQFPETCKSLKERHSKELAVWLGACPLIIGW